MHRFIAALFLVCMTASATPLRVIDGDTFIALLEVHSQPIWLNGTVATVTFLERIRVLGVDTPETKGATLVAGHAAKSFTTTWLGCTTPNDCKKAKIVTICSDKYDDFGRALATVKRDDGHDLTTDLITTGNGIKFP